MVLIGFSLVWIFFVYIITSSSAVSVQSKVYSVMRIAAGNWRCRGHWMKKAIEATSELPFF